MRGSSRGSQAAAIERVEALLDSPDASRLGEDLFSVAGLLDSSAGLRRALTDPSRDGDAKAALVSTLLEGKVGGSTLDVVSGMVRDRWATARDLADACEHIGALAVLASAQVEDRLDTVEDEIFRFGRIVAGNRDLRLAMGERARSSQHKGELVDALLADKVAPQTLVLARQAVVNPRGRRLEDVLESFGQAAALRRQRLVARVTAAVPLTEEQRERLVQVLARVYERTMHLDVDVDPRLVGGLRVQVGDEVIDASVLTRLDEARRRLAG